MANLLPIEYQKKVRRSLRARFIIVGAGTVGAIAVVTLLSLVPSYLAVRFSIPAPESPAQPSPVSDADRSQIAEVQAFTDQLRPFVAASTTPTEALLLALAVKPSGISLDNVTYSGGTGAAGQLILAGSTRAPDLISAYQSALAKDAHFKSVSVPVGALVGTREGRFTITLTGPF